MLRTFGDTFSSLRPDKPWVTKLSSAGLVYVHFGRRLLAQLTQLKEGDRQLEVLYDKVSASLGLAVAIPRRKKVDCECGAWGVWSLRLSSVVLKIETTRPRRWKNAEPSRSLPGRPCEDSWQWRGRFERNREQRDVARFLSHF